MALFYLTFYFIVVVFLQDYNNACSFVPESMPEVQDWIGTFALGLQVLYGFFIFLQFVVAMGNKPHTARCERCRHNTPGTQARTARTAIQHAHAHAPMQPLTRAHARAHARTPPGARTSGR